MSYDIINLKRTLLEQKKPLEQAVEEKLRYLQSDDVFTGPISGYEDLYHGTASSESLENDFASAFGLPSDTSSAIQNNSSSEIRIQTAKIPASEVNQPMRKAENPPQKNMSVAERIAVLRGAMSSNQGFSNYKR